jgi:hypothetical protein
MTGDINTDLSCYLKIRWNLVSNIYLFLFYFIIFFIDRSLNLVTLIANEVRYRNNVLQCYTFVIHCSSGIFLSSPMTAIWLFDSNRKPLVPWPGLRS